VRVRLQLRSRDRLPRGLAGAPQALERLRLDRVSPVQHDAKAQPLAAEEDAFIEQRPAPDSTREAVETRVRDSLCPPRVVAESQMSSMKTRPAVPPSPADPKRLATAGFASPTQPSSSSRAIPFGEAGRIREGVAVVRHPVRESALDRRSRDEKAWRTRRAVGRRVRVHSIRDSRMGLKSGRLGLPFLEPGVGAVHGEVVLRLEHEIERPPLASEYLERRRHVAKALRLFVESHRHAGEGDRFVGLRQVEVAPRADCTRKAPRPFRVEPPIRQLGEASRSRSRLKSLRSSSPYASSISSKVNRCPAGTTVWSKLSAQRGGATVADADMVAHRKRARGIENRVARDSSGRSPSTGRFFASWM